MSGVALELFDSCDCFPAHPQQTKLLISMAQKQLRALYLICVVTTVSLAFTVIDPDAEVRIHCKCSVFGAKRFTELIFKRRRNWGGMKWWMSQINTKGK